MGTDGTSLHGHTSGRPPVAFPEYSQIAADPVIGCPVIESHFLDTTYILRGHTWRPCLKGIEQSTLRDMFW